MPKIQTAFARYKQIRRYCQIYGMRAIFERLVNSLQGRLSKSFVGGNVRRIKSILGVQVRDHLLSMRSFDYIFNDTTDIPILQNDSRVTWIVPEYGPSSGGHRTIFRHISELARLGIKSRMVVIETNNSFSLQQAHKNLPKDLDLSSLEIELATCISSLSTIIIVTSWHTAYWARSIAETKRCRVFYFIQDFEPSFYPSGSLSILASETYLLPYTHIYASDWLACVVPKNESMCLDKYVVNLGVDPKEFPVSGEILNEREQRIMSGKTLNIAVYYRPVTPRRMEEHAYLLLAYISRFPIKARLHFYGWDWAKSEWPHESHWHKCHGILSHVEIGAFLNNMDACILFGSTNVSLMPLETMAAGLPTFVNEGKNNYCLLEDLPIYFSNIPNKGFKQIIDVIENRQMLVDKMRYGFSKSVSKTWNAQSKALFDIIASSNSLRF